VTSTWCSIEVVGLIVDCLPSGRGDLHEDDRPASAIALDDVNGEW
jgi:hypothetical protein